MKRYIALILLAVMLLTAGALAERLGDVELAALNRDELNALNSDIEAELELHHETDSHAEGEVLDAVKAATESYFAEQGIEISWAWIDYSYTRDWDFYTLSTHIDYRDANDIKQKPGVYAEVFCEDGRYNVYYLLIGTDAVIDRRAELPDELWSEAPEGIVNEATGLDLSTASREELTELKAAVQAEYSENHSPKSTINDLVLSLTKLEIEQRFAADGIKASWPWFDYTYTCDWDLYTLETSVDYRDAEGKSHSDDVYAEAYPISGKYELCYLKLGDDVLIDARDQLPEALYFSDAQTEAKPEATPEETAEPEKTAEPEEADEPEETAEPEEAAESEETAEPIHLERGAKGDDVKALQQRLIAVGHLDGGADGDFGKKTAAAVEALQEAHDLEQTGVFADAEEAALSEDLREYARRAILVAMTNAQSMDVFTSDGSAYDPSKFHNYAYTGEIYAALHEDGDWTRTGRDAWHVEDIRLKLEGLDDSYMKLTLDVRFDGENFVLSHVSKTQGRLAYLDSGDGSKLNFEELEPSEVNPFLTVSPAMLREDRGGAAPEEARDESAASGAGEAKDSEREDWIASQFSIWNGSHKILTDLIKESLNDERSYEHIETNYIDVQDERVCDLVNDTLKKMGQSQRVEVGDLFIMTEFSAKNAFNARIKAVAYGIASYKEQTVELIAIQ